VEGLKREFKISIDEYLAFCKKEGVKPQKPYSGKVTVNLETRTETPILHKPSFSQRRLSM
jgi:predicted HicB family RNase H-like nuclease